MDFTEDLKTKVIPFLKNKNITAEVVLLDETDATSFIPKIENRWTGALPATIVKLGAKRNFAEKKLHYAELQQMILDVKK